MPQVEEEFRAKQKIEQPYSKQARHSFEFWKLSIKWYFFPILYVVLALLFVVIYIIKESVGFNNFGKMGGVFLMSLYFLPNGLILLIEELGSYVQREAGEEFFLVFPIVFHMFWIVSVGVIQFFKIRSGKIVRWLIITVFLAMILSFIGCTESLLVGKELNFF